MTKQKSKGKLSIGRRPILITGKGGPHKDRTKFLRCRDKHIEDSTYTTQEPIGE